MASHPREWAFIAALAAALWGLHAARRHFGFFALLVLPGTFAHEGSHWLLGLLLNGRPQRFNLLPRREARGWIMGSVTLGNPRWYNAFFIGLAPLLLLPLAYGLMLWRVGLAPDFRWQEALAVYLIANLVYAAVPSGQDLKVAARSPVGWLLLAAGLGWAWRRWHRDRPPAVARITASTAATAPPTPWPAR